jgi:hypothetical protein
VRFGAWHNAWTINSTDGGEVSLTRKSELYFQEDSWYSFLSEAAVFLETLGQMKNLKALSGEP